MITDSIQGVAQALMFGIFGVSAMGKLVECRRGVGCGKAALDLALAGLAGLAWWSAAAWPLALAAFAIGAGGWIRERLRGSDVCNCFGVLTPALHPWRNHVRAMLVAAAIALPGARLVGGIAESGLSSYLGGLAAAGMLIVLACAYAHASAAPRFKQAKKPSQVLQRGDAALQPADVLGTAADGSVVHVRDLMRAGQPLALLFTRTGCAQCELVKAELEPVREHFSFPLRILSSDVPEMGTSTLHDVGGALSKRFELEGVPSMAVIDEGSLALFAPVSFGAATIYRDIVRLTTTRPT